MIAVVLCALAGGHSADAQEIAAATVDPRDRAPAQALREAQQTAALPGAIGGMGGFNISTRRLIHLFDFEERKLGNFESMPMHWHRIHREGFPAYTHIALDTEQSDSGEYSVKVALNGGSAGLVLETGTIAAVPGSDYLLTGKVRTDGLDHARAIVTACFADEHGKIIDASYARSSLLSTDEQWQTVTVRLNGDHPHAAWIIIKLMLIQPSEFPDKPAESPLGAHDLYYQDVDGSAWFDDVGVYQLPRVELQTQTPTNVILQPDRPQFSVTVRDLTGEKLMAAITVYDRDGHVVDQTYRPLDGRGAPYWPWAPKMTEAGWYWADLLVKSPTQIVGRRAISLVWLPRRDPQQQVNAMRFCVISESMPPTHRHLLPDLIRRVGSGSLLLNIWHEQMTHRDLAALSEQPDSTIEQLIEDGQRLTLSLPQVPRVLALAARTDVETPIDLFANKPDVWQGYLDSTLIRYGLQVHRWQIGRTGHTEAFWRDDLDVIYPRINAFFSRYIGQPIVGLPWSAQHPLPGGSPHISALTINIPQSIQPQQIPVYAQTWPRPDQPRETTLALATLDPRQYTHQDRANDLAIRMLYAWSTRPDALAIAQPWDHADARSAAILPDPLLAVWSNVSSHLWGRQVVRQLLLDEGLVCYILDGPRGGALMIWNRNSEIEQPVLDAYLGDVQPVAVDIWGNRQPVPLVDGRHHLPVGQSPLFIENIDAKLARLRAGFQIRPDFAESVYEIHEHRISLTNPFNRTLSGRLVLHSPDHWQIRPRLIHMSIPPGETLTAPIEIIFPISELAGRKFLGARIEPDNQGPMIEIVTPLRVGMRDVLLRPSAMIEGPDVVIATAVTNVGEVGRTLYVSAAARDQARTERIISNLQPGHTQIKTFRFSGAAAELRGQTVRVAVRDIKSPAMLNKAVQVP